MQHLTILRILHYSTSYNHYCIKTIHGGKSHTDMPKHPSYCNRQNSAIHILLVILYDIYIYWNNHLQ